MKNLSEYLVHLLRRGSVLDRAYLSVLRDHCVLCGEAISESAVYLRYRLCPHCRFHYSLTARERIDLVADKGSFRETNRSIVSLFPISFSARGSYTKRLSQDQRRTGLTEAAVTGRCTISGIRTMMIVLDFGFMGGSMGSVVGEKVALAFENASSKGHPVVAMVSGGGARSQEGVLSLMQMAKTVAAANKVREKQLPFVVILSNPSTGQAYASFANLADVIFAEPGSLIGLAPMKTLKEASGKPVPLNAHTAEAHVDLGLLDNVIDREELRDKLSTVLDILSPDRPSRSNGKGAKEAIPVLKNQESDVSQALEASNHPRRPSAWEYVKQSVENFIELRGDRVSGDDRTLIGGLGYLGAERVAIVGQERKAQRRDGGYHSYPEGFRKARRVINLAARFKLPVVTLIDTQGAHPGLESEEQGVGNAIATTLSLMADVPTPTVSAIIGEGGSEGALALSLTDNVVMLENAIYSAISPGPTVSRLHGNAPHRTEEKESLTLTAHDCKELGIIDDIVPEPEDGAHSDPGEAARYLRLVLTSKLAKLAKASSKKLVQKRYKKFRRMGEYSRHSQAAIRREVSLMEHIVLKEPPDGGNGKRQKVSSPSS